MDNRPIGVFDSGLGGLTAVRQLRRVLPGEDIVYFGDTGRVPYGSRAHDTIVQYAKNAKTAGLDGVVCSPLEAGMVKDACGKAFMTVTPGVRFADGDLGDQVRVTTPAKAKEIGSDYIVVGRPITAADDPVAAYRRCCREFID